MGAAQVKGGVNINLNTQNSLRFNNFRSWHDEAYLYINQAITQVSEAEAGH